MRCIKWLLCLVLLSVVSAYGAKIKGIVTDAVSSNPLSGANVIVDGTSLGAASDLEGRFTIPAIPPGMYTLKITYIGYEQATYDVYIMQPDQTVIQNVEMEMSFVTGETVVVSAQSVGQLSAINQQLSADAMMNIVDAERIQELPDQNVAESIARLPGITVSRVDGEGSAIRIRGLGSQYNQVQMEGVVMSSSGNMGRAEDVSNNQTRSVSLQNIAQDNLSGIEVYKAILPDMDAATLGGTVNMRLGKAPEEDVYELKAYGAYNAYRDDWNQYKLVGKMSRRFFNNKFGIQLSANAERRNRGSDRLGGSIEVETPFVDGERVVQYKTANANISHKRNIYTKQAVDAIFDYATEGTELLFSNFFNLGQFESKDIFRGSSVQGTKTNSNSYAISNALRGTHKLSKFELEWSLSHNRSKTDTPDDYQIRFAFTATDQDELDLMRNLDLYEITPEEYMNLKPNTGIWTFREVYKDVGETEEINYAEKFDVKYPFYFGKVSGFFKAGGLFRQVQRSNRFKQRSLFDGQFPEGASGPKWVDYATDYNPDPILNDKVSLRHYIDVDKIKSVWTDWIKDYQFAAYHPLKTSNRDYDITENYYAGYLMMKLGAFNDLLTFIPGIRYEGDNFDATGYYHYIQNESTITVNGVYEKRNAKREHGFWLPMVHLKVKPLEWLDTRFAYTETISRPRFNYLLPSVTVTFDPGGSIYSGNPDLKTTESKNYDLSMSIYNNKLGLITIAGFYKEIKNFSYMLDYYVGGDEDALKYGLHEDDPAFDKGHYDYKYLNTPTNTHGISTVKGFEIEYQANLNAMPGLFKHMVFGMNYSRIFSKSWLRWYELTLDSLSYISEPPYVVEHTSTSVNYRRGRMVGQPDQMFNVFIGYEVGGFSGRISTFYQGRSLEDVARLPIEDMYVEDFIRFDISMRYRVNDKLSFLLTGVNLTSTPDKTSYDGTSKHSSYSVYGPMYDFGVQYTF